LIVKEGYQWRQDRDKDNGKYQESKQLGLPVNGPVDLVKASGKAYESTEQHKDGVPVPKVFIRPVAQPAAHAYRYQQLQGETAIPEIIVIRTGLLAGL
jgi:hypothetical protein